MARITEYRTHCISIDDSFVKHVSVILLLEHEPFLLHYTEHYEKNSCGGLKATLYLTQ